MQRPLVLNDLRATALAWSSFAAVAEADCGFSRNYPEQQSSRIGPIMTTRELTIRRFSSSTTLHRLEA